MVWLLKWLLAPIVVVVVAILLASGGWFEHGLVILTFAIAAVVMLFLWRRAAFRLAPEVWKPDPSDLANLDAASKRKLTLLTCTTWGLTLTVMTAVVLVVILVPAAGTLNASVAAVAIVFTVPFSKLVLLCVFAQPLLDHHRRSGAGSAQC